MSSDDARITFYCLLLLLLFLVQSEDFFFENKNDTLKKKEEGEGEEEKGNFSSGFRQAPFCCLTQKYTHVEHNSCTY
jgi:hypothetical protein